MTKQSWQKGVSLIDMMISVAVIMILTIIFTAVVKNFSDARIVARQGQLLTSGADAMDKYLQKNGLNIISGTVAGVINPLSPTRQELIDIGVLTPSFPTQSYFGGQVNFSVRIDVTRNLMGLVCDPSTITDKGVASTPLSGRISSSIEGGVSTNPLTPTILNGASYQNIPANISNNAMVCAIKTLSNPT